MVSTIHHATQTNKRSRRRKRMQREQNLPRRHLPSKSTRLERKGENPAARERQGGGRGVPTFERNAELLALVSINKHRRPPLLPSPCPSSRLTPRLNGLRYGVFATRSIHLPNRLGLSCCELVSIGLRTHPAALDSRQKVYKQKKGSQGFRWFGMGGGSSGV